MSWLTKDCGAEEIYKNQKVKMQAAAFKDKKKGIPGNHEGADDPDYENITLTFRNQHQPKSGHLPSQSQVPATSRPPSEPAKAPQWLYRAIMSLYILLALTFVFFIILSAMILVKNSEMSQELLALKGRLWNVTNVMRESQEEQSKQQKLFQEELKTILSTITQNWNAKLDSLQKGALEDLVSICMEPSQELVPPDV
ncbi:LOW QUALITY PROTEIN: mast cell-expressed membrane protein 1 [Rhynchocyon petersi]